MEGQNQTKNRSGHRSILCDGCRRAYAGTKEWSIGQDTGYYGWCDRITGTIMIFDAFKYLGWAGTLKSKRQYLDLEATELGPPGVLLRFITPLRPYFCCHFCRHIVFLMIKICQISNPANLILELLSSNTLRFSGLQT